MSILGHRRGEHLDAIIVPSSCPFAPHLGKHLILIHHGFQFPLVGLAVWVVLLISTLVHLKMDVNN